METGGAICKISEKPEFNYQVNTGIYVMESTVLGEIPRGKVYQMTDLLDRLMREGRRVGAYPVTENCWKDMGELNEMHKMLDAFQTG